MAGLQPDGDRPQATRDSHPYSRIDYPELALKDEANRIADCVEAYRFARSIDSQFFPEPRHRRWAYFR